MAVTRSGMSHIVTTAVVSGLLSIIMTITWFTARDAMGVAVGNMVDVGVLQTKSDTFEELLLEVRDDVKEILRST